MDAGVQAEGLRSGGAKEESMTGDELLTRLRSRQAADLRACFPGLGERELMQLLTAPQHAIRILQCGWGCDVADAKAAWNDYVLRYVDGAGAGAQGWSGPGGAQQARARLS
jgi:hypothetical protein